MWSPLANCKNNFSSGDLAKTPLEKKTTRRKFSSGPLEKPYPTGNENGTFDLGDDVAESTESRPRGRMEREERQSGRFPPLRRYPIKHLTDAKVGAQIRSITEINIPNSLRRICGYAFCDSLHTPIRLHDGIENIGEGALAYCIFTNFRIPPLITSISRDLLYMCKSKSMSQR